MPRKPISDEDKALFREAMKQVTPLKTRTVVNKEVLKEITPARPKPAISDSNINKPHSTTYLSNHYYDPVHAETVLTYYRHAIPIKRQRELKQGKIPIEAKLDLHGLTLEEAEQALIKFIHHQTHLHHRCLLIIHGKGSQTGEPPVLKNLVNHWLRQFSQVLAFHSALPQEGGSGALYVLLKRNHAY